MAACSVAVLGLVLWQRFVGPAKNADSRPRIDRETWHELTSAGHRIGPADAPLEIVLFSDFQCPFCANFELSVLTPLRAEFPDGFSVLFRHWPLSVHPESQRIALAAECAGAQGKFDQFQHAAFAAQKELADLSIDSLAAANGVHDMERFAVCQRDEEGKSTIARDVALAQKIGSTGTPAVIIDGEWYPGGGPRVDQLREMIRKAAR
jgi:protein-disulfide isomerase